MNLRIFTGALLLAVALPAHAADNNPFSGARSISITMTRDGTKTQKPTSFFHNSIHAESCTASQYGIGDGYHGKRTASGAIFNTWAMTAAHRTRRFGSHVTVTNRNNGRSVAVKITDRGPFVRGRCIDLSRAAANAIGMGGTAPVSVQ